MHGFLTEHIQQPHKTDDLSKIPEKPAPRVLPVDIPPRSLSHISEASQATSDKPWAITQQFQSTQKARAPPSRVSLN